VSIIGTRRWGKTYYFYDVMKKLIQQGKEKNELLYVNFEDERILPFDVKDFDSLPEAYFELFPENKKKRPSISFWMKSRMLEIGRSQ